MRNNKKTEPTKAQRHTPLIFFCVSFLLVSVALCLLIFFYYKMEIKAVLEVQHIRESYHQKTEKQKIQKTINDVFNDLLLLRDQNELLDFLDTDKQKFLDLAQYEYFQLALRQPNYDQIRFIDTKGKERIKIKNDHVPIVLRRQQLQDKHSRYYFTECFKLTKGEIYISPLVLNIDNKSTNCPCEPMLRIGTPVFDRTGKKTGIILINYRAQHLLNKLEISQNNSQTETMLLNQDGYWLLHPNRELEWGFMKTEKKNLALDNQDPDLWLKIQNEQKGRIEKKEGFYTFTTISLQAKNTGISRTGVVSKDSLYSWILLSYTSNHSTYTSKLKSRTLILTIVLIVVAGVGLYFLAQAIHKRNIYQQELEKMAYNDALTGLANRRIFFIKVTDSINYSKRYKNKIAVLFLDLDGFKAVNDTLGHDAGDTVLCQVADSLNYICRSTDTVSRLGGDEFAILIPHYKEQEEVKILAQRIITELAKPIKLSKGTTTISVSIGITFFPLHGPDATTLVKNADGAMYTAKNNGKNQYSVFTITETQPN